ncbi:MAG TPA: YegS/Rv2252/BmrU family lipid kinase [Candidatus Limnocylindrales bacterium]|nr:YegS/Rv2252/BmrU family lipid kinase [Candidatus Limnocylindrales bacterium]
MSKLGSVELLINMKSRSGRRALKQVLDTCDSNNISLTRVHKITDTGRLSAVLAGIRKRAPDTLITASGDGTVSDVVDYLAGTSIKLGFVPLGTTNNFARSLGVPLDIEAAVGTIARGQTRTIALGQAGDDFFANVAGVGMSARIARAVTPERKQRFGRFAYALTALHILMTHQPFFVQLKDKDGEFEAHFETHQLIVANGRYHAGTEIAADADLSHSELVVFKLGGPSRFSLIWHMLDFYFGKRRSVSHSAYFIGKNIYIQTSRPQPVELDGEVKLETPLAVRVHADAVEVYC